MMYCIRSYIPLLLLPLPLSLSPIHLTTLLILTYILNRPCVYCSFLLIILFASSCNWSGRCFFDFSTDKYGYADWFLPRIYTQADGSSGNVTVAEFAGEVINSTLPVLARAAFDEVKRKVTRSIPSEGLSPSLPDSIGVGTSWLKTLLGRNEWTLPCVDVKIRI